MAESADSGMAIAVPTNGRSGSERLFLTSLFTGMVIWLGLSLGLSGLFSGMGDAGTWTVRLLPWVALAISALALTRVFSEVGGGLKFFGNRFRAHAIGWLIIAAILLFIAIAGQPLQSVFDLLGKSGKIIVRFCGEHGYFWAACAILIALGLLAIGVRDPSVAAPGRMERTFVQKLTAKVAAIPMALVAIGVFTGGTLWTVVFSFTNSKLLPVTKWVGFDQYIRLWGESRWIISIKNLAIYGVCSLVLSLVIGFILAALLDQKIRFENTFRTILLYPFALSFIVTGLVWQWVLNPDFGVQQVVRSLGWSNFVFDPLYDQNIVIFGILIAGLWQGTGFIMCLMLAGLRGIDEDIWKAARVDGIPMWRTYIFVVLPMMRPVLITTLVIIASGIVRLYDLVVAQTSGGPGIASEVPAKYVYDKMFLGQNLAQGFAASTMMLLSVFIILVPWAYLEFGGGKNKND